MESILGIRSFLGCYGIFIGVNGVCMRACKMIFSYCVNVLKF